ncbi:MAG: hypothetical protein IT370_21205 [Deltaproteobacteria bacterium]|nr:hypothetical protein [Deltaproteobacteria bacterium]
MRLWWPSVALLVSACSGPPGGSGHDAAMPDAASADAALADAASTDRAAPDAALQITIIATPPSLTLTEGSVTPGLVMIRLRDQPGSDVVVDLTLADPTQASVAPTQLRFTPSDFAAAQAVSLLAIQDRNLVSSSTTLTASAPGAAPATVTLQINDQDDGVIAVSPTALALDEGSSANLQVGLSFETASTDFTITLAPSLAGKLTVTPSSVTILHTDPPLSRQTVVVTALDDADLVDDALTLTLSSPGNLPSVTVPIAVTDDD